MSDADAIAITRPTRAWHELAIAASHVSWRSQPKTARVFVPDELLALAAQLVPAGGWGLDWVRGRSEPGPQRYPGARRSRVCHLHAALADARRDATGSSEALYTLALSRREWESIAERLLQGIAKMTGGHWMWLFEVRPPELDPKAVFLAAHTDITTALATSLPPRTA